jgi:hypothetical protein
MKTEDVDLVNNLAKKKNLLADERDLCAEVYNFWITRMHEFQDNPQKYEMYINMIQVMEPYGQIIKEEIREINREICEIYGVDSIEQTPHSRECVSRYGKDRPNAE